MFEYDTRIRGLIAGIGVLILGVVLAGIGVFPASILDSTILDDPYAASRDALLTYMVLNFLGFFVAGAAYMAITGRGWDFIDIRMPNRSDLKWMIGGLVITLVFYYLVGIIATVLDLPAAESDIVLMLGDDVMMVLAMMLIVLFLNAPAEEFLFRNVIQKRLYDSFSEIGAVIVASLIFVLPHLPSYMLLAESHVATVVSLTILFGGSMVMGYAYLRTRNILVPTAIHAGMNLFMLVIYLLALIYDLEEELASAALLVLPL